MDTLAKNVSCVSEYAWPETVMNCAKGSMHNLGYISDSESVKETVLADLTSSLNKTLSKSCYESEETVFSPTEKATKNNRSHVNDLNKQRTVSGAAPLAAPCEANVPVAETNVQCVLNSCDMRVKHIPVCESDQETNNELLSDSTGNNVNVFHVANLTHNQSETMNSEFKHFKNAGLDLENSRSVYIESVHPPDMCSKPGGIENWFSPA